MNLRRLISAAAAVLITIAAAAGAFAGTDEIKVVTTEKSEKHRQITSLPVYIVLPDGNNFERNGKTIADKNAHVCITLSEAVVPFCDLIGEFRGEALKERGLELKCFDLCRWNGRESALCKAFFTAEEKAHLGNWILLIDSGESTWLLSGVYDKRDEDASQRALDIVKSTWIEEPELTLLKNSPLRELGRIETSGTAYRYAGTSQGAAVYTKDGLLPTKGADGAIFVLSEARSNYPPPEKYAEVVRRHCAAAVGHEKYRIISEKEVIADGLEGYETVAVTEDGEDNLVYCTVLFDGDKCRKMVGIVCGGEENVADFSKMAMSFRRYRESEPCEMFR